MRLSPPPTVILPSTLFTCPPVAMVRNCPTEARSCCQVTDAHSCCIGARSQETRLACSFGPVVLTTTMSASYNELRSEYRMMPWSQTAWICSARGCRCGTILSGECLASTRIVAEACCRTERMSLFTPAICALPPGPFRFVPMGS